MYSLDNEKPENAEVFAQNLLGGERPSQLVRRIVISGPLVLRPDYAEKPTEPVINVYKKTGWREPTKKTPAKIIGRRLYLPSFEQRLRVRSKFGGRWRDAPYCHPILLNPMA